MPSVKADTQILALLCRVHHTFFRDTPTTINLGGLCAAQLCPQVHTHHWCPLPYRQAACGQGSCQAALPSPESPRPVGTVPHWHPTSPGAAGITLPPSPLALPLPSFPSQLFIFRLFQPKWRQQTLRFSKKCPSLFSGRKSASELL